MNKEEILQRVKDEYAASQGCENWDTFISNLPFYDREQHYDNITRTYHAERLKEVGECFDGFDIAKMDSMTVEAEVEYLNNKAAAFTSKQTEKLQAWKESANKVLNNIDIQAIGKEIGVKLGEDISSKILPWVKEAKKRMSGMFTEYDIRSAILMAIGSNVNVRSNITADEVEEEIIRLLKM